MKQSKEELLEGLIRNPPLLRLGEVVIVYPEQDVQKATQGRVKTAEFFREWFYGIEIENVTGEPTMVYTYEQDTGDAKTKIFYPPSRFEGERIKYEGN